jgi:diguanylate cyclase (GGDEF)-like protein
MREEFPNPLEKPNGDSEIDELTGLPNSRWLNYHLDEIIEKRPGEFALVFADLDNLKAVNDEYDHDEGDRYIQNVAHVLRELTRRNDIVVVRISGDEFILLLLGITDERTMNTVIERLSEELDELGAPVSFGGKVHRVGLTAKCLRKEADGVSKKDKRERKKAIATPRQIQLGKRVIEELAAEGMSSRQLASFDAAGVFDDE